MSEKYDGLIIYTIEADGCLNGVYTNTNNPKENGIYNECARKIPGSSYDIDGTYDCIYIQYNPKKPDQQEICYGTLEIEKDAERYKLKWKIIYNSRDNKKEKQYSKKKPICFEGIGLIRDQKLVVSYRGVDKFS